ncbi:MAG: hypothetical protein AVDCRST_MAG27-3185 [uncultured Craurococcus sp.]|uniref:Uncharacterized protein n=1 Tax=uncultured Craurococcus sp. TaxID=1135998 RepID=A0A6J4J7Q6_9PROT|nr:MAG: hypothetical protein AVDCRST_MAG27-3185 [uncultured Craurococcus sp.]
MLQDRVHGNGVPVAVLTPAMPVEAAGIEARIARR